MEQNYLIKGSLRKNLKKQRSTLRILIRDFWKSYEKDLTQCKKYGVKTHLTKGDYDRHYNILKGKLNDLDNRLNLTKNEHNQECR